MSPSSRRTAPRRPRVGVVKFASCDGCQLTVLDLEDDLLAIAERFDIVEFPEATSRRSSGPFDVLLVEGSISTHEQLEELLRLRRETTTLVTIGACATAGGIQAIRNWSDHGPWAATVYPQPELVDSLATATPVADHVVVDAELRGCPIDPRQLLELLTAARRRAAPAAPRRIGLRRMQAARGDLRRRRVRDRLPRTGHPDRLRRPLPGLRTRLLRLLRTARRRQRDRPASPAPPGSTDARRRVRSSPASRSGPSRSARS